MNFPRLKNALLCRILVYVVVLGGFIAPIIIVANLKFVPEAVKVIVGIGLAVGLLIYLIKNFVLLMAMDVGLAMLHCHNTARKCFALPKSFSAQKMREELPALARNTSLLPFPIAQKHFDIRVKHQ